jgi:hypothetical protein
MRLILFAIFWLLTLPSPGQVHIYTDLSDTSKNYLYRELENPVRISGITEKYTVSISNGDTIKKAGKDLFLVKLHSQGNSTLIRVTKEGSQEILAWKKFEVRSCGWAESNWPSDTKIARDSLLKMPLLTMTTPAHCSKKLNYQIVSFDVAIDHADSSIVFPIKGNQFSPELIRHLETKRDGTLITFDNIRAQGPDGRPGKIPGVWLYLK